MMHEKYLQEGDLNSSLESIQNEIRANASDVKSRIFLFQLLVILGQWDRAAKQLDVIANMDISTLPMVNDYRTAIECERYREDVFLGKNDPVFMGKPDEWQALILQSLKLTAKDKDNDSSLIRNQALEMAPTIAGTINSEAFEWIADADSRLGPLLEVFVEGQYRWVPFTNIKRIAIEVPENLRDFVWVPAHIQWASEGESFVFIPTRYPFSAEQDDQLALSRKTVWVDHGEDSFAGFGQRLLTTDLNDYSLLDIRDIFFEQVTATT